MKEQKEPKEKMDGKVIMNLAGRLFVITLVASVLLGVVSAVTAEPIAIQEKLKEDNGMAAVLPAASAFEIVDEPTEGLVRKVSKGMNDEGDCGYVVSAYPSGFGGEITLMVGIDLSGTVTGVRILSLSETPGLGAKATEPAFYEQYTGKTDMPLSVTKSAPGSNQIQAITSATITSAAVTDGVNAAYEWFVENGGAE